MKSAVVALYTNVVQSGQFKKARWEFDRLVVVADREGDVMYYNTQAACEQLLEDIMADEYDNDLVHVNERPNFITPTKDILMCVESAGDVRVVAINAASLVDKYAGCPPLPLSTSYFVEDAGFVGAPPIDITSKESLARVAATYASAERQVYRERDHVEGVTELFSNAIGSLLGGVEGAAEIAKKVFEHIHGLEGEVKDLILSTHDGAETREFQVGLDSEGNFLSHDPAEAHAFHGCILHCLGFGEGHLIVLRDTGNPLRKSVEARGWELSPQGAKPLEIFTLRRGINKEAKSDIHFSYVKADQIE